MEYQLIMDIGFFILLGLIMVVAFIVPSKKRIINQGIVFVSPLALKGQLILGGIAILLGLGLFVFYWYENFDVLHNLINGIVLLPVGLLLIYNSNSTNKLVDEVSMGDEGLVIVDTVEDEIIAVAEVQERQPKVRPSAPATNKTYETITIQCPGCDKFLKIENRGEGTPITCPGCGLEGEL